MNPKLKFILTLVLCVALFASAYILYNRLSPQIEVQQLDLNAPGFVANTERPLLAEETPAPTESASSDALPTEAPSVQSSPDETSIPTVPDFPIVNTDGQTVQLSDFFGKPIVLNFWASWCSSCRMGMKALQNAYDRYGDEVHFLMVNMTDGARETIATASECIEQEGYTFPVYYDTTGTAALFYSVYSLPTTYFIDENGHYFTRAIGALNDQGLEDVLRLMRS